MNGLLDFIKTPEGQGLLSATFGGLAGARRGQPLNSIGRAGMSGLLGYGQATERQDMLAERAKADEVRALQMQQMQQQLASGRMTMEEQAAARLRRQQIRDAAASSVTPALPAMGGLNSMLPPEMQTPVVPGKAGGFDTSGFLNKLRGIEPLTALEWEQKLVKEPKYQVVGDALVRTDTPEPREMYRAPAKPEATPSAIKEYQFAQMQGYKGSFEQWATQQKRAGATSVNVNSDNLGLKPKDKFEMEGKLSDDFSKATQLDRGVLNATSKIAAAFTESGAMKDQAAIYSFAKMLDPEGAVREADYAAIANTAGLVDRVRNYANKLLTGEQLNPTQRAEMISLAKSFEKVANSRIAPQRSRFARQATRYNLSPDAVLSPDSSSVGWSITPVR